LRPHYPRAHIRTTGETFPDTALALFMGIAVAAQLEAVCGGEPGPRTP
jgi:hypothetical protein